MKHLVLIDEFWDKLLEAVRQATLEQREAFAQTLREIGEQEEISCTTHLQGKSAIVIRISATFDSAQEAEQYAIFRRWLIVRH